MRLVKSDEFNGFKPKEVACLRLLAGDASPSDDDLLRLKFGCTCGQCLGDFLSPHTLCVLEYEADTAYESNPGYCRYISALGSEWSEDWRHFLRLVEADLQEMFRSDKALRGAFTEVVYHISECLRRKKLPTTANVIECLDDECPPHTRDIINFSGSVGSAFIGCAALAIKTDLYIANAAQENFMGELIQELRYNRTQPLPQNLHLHDNIRNAVLPNSQGRVINRIAHLRLRHELFP